MQQHSWDSYSVPGTAGTHAVLAGEVLVICESRVMEIGETLSEFTRVNGSQVAQISPFGQQRLF